MNAALRALRQFEGAYVIVPPTGANANAYKIYATIYMQNARSLLAGYGALLSCATRDVCLFLGDRVSSGDFASSTVQGLRFTSTVNVDGVQVTNAAVTGGNLVTLKYRKIKISCSA